MSESGLIEALAADPCGAVELAEPSDYGSPRLWSTAHGLRRARALVLAPGGGLPASASGVHKSCTGQRQM
jgi:hypothetical protein